MRVVPLLSLVALAIGACGDDGASPSGTRADQVRSAAEEAGLPDDVIDVLVLAARGVGRTFQVTYPGSDGTAVVISQDPPDRRVDLVAGARIVRSQVVRGGVGYRCEPDEGDAGGELTCRRAQSALDVPGTFTEDALATFTEELAASQDHLELTVESRTIAGTEATCLVAAPDEGRVETICVSDEGAQLLVDAAGERLEASAYTSDVPEGTFDTSRSSPH